MPYITKQFKFCAAHRYWNPKWDEDKNYSVFGDDVKVHGHNYVLDITITGPINPDSGFIFDIQELKMIVDRNVIKKIDHSLIQEDIDYGIGIIHENIIDEINILNATKEAMLLAVSALENKPDNPF